jgi:hypothetical protein
MILIIGVFTLKFKYLVIALSILIVIIMLIAVLLPVLLAGPELAVNFRLIVLPLLIFMLLLLVCVSVFFLLNYRLFSLLEREDWPALSYYLEQQIYVKGKYNAQKVRLLASSYLVASDYSSVLKLESKAMLAKPSVVDKNALIFGAARILSGNPKEAAAYFKTYLEKGSNREKQWVRWFLGFSQLLDGVFSMAEQEFMSLAISSDDVLITGLSAYFLDSLLIKHSLKPEECRAVAENGRGRVVKTLKNAGNWKKEADKEGTEIHAAIIRKYIDEAGKWLFIPIAGQ